MKNSLYLIFFCFGINLLEGCKPDPKNILKPYFACIQECNSMQEQIESKYSICVSSVKIDTSKLTICTHVAPANMSKCQHDVIKTFVEERQKCDQQRSEGMKLVSKCREDCRSKLP